MPTQLDEKKFKGHVRHLVEGQGLSPDFVAEMAEIYWIGTPSCFPRRQVPREARWHTGTHVERFIYFAEALAEALTSPSWRRQDDLDDLTRRFAEGCERVGLPVEVSHRVQRAQFEAWQNEHCELQGANIEATLDLFFERVDDDLRRRAQTTPPWRIFMELRKDLEAEARRRLYGVESDDLDLALNTAAWRLFQLENGLIGR